MISRTMKPRTLGSRTIRRGLVPLLALAVALTACGSSSSGASDVPTLNKSSAKGASATTTTVDPEKAVQEFVTCLRAQGIKVADPKVDSDGQIDFRSIFQGADIQPGSDTFRTAQEKCGDKLRNAGFGPNANDQKARQEAQVAFTACLRKQGLTVGDFPTNGPGFGPGGAPNGAGNGGTGNSSGAPTTTVAGGATPTTAANGPGNGPGGGGFRPPQTEEERNARLAEILDLDINDSKVTAAFKSCSKELSALNQGGPGGRRTTTTTTAG